jgi:hypothetical protein
VPPQGYLNHLKHEIYTQVFSDDVYVTTNLPAIVNMTHIDDMEMVTQNTMFEFDAMNDEAPNIPSPNSTEILDDDQPLCDMDTKLESSNKHSIIDNIDHQKNPCNQVKLTPNGIRFRNYELGKVKLYYNTTLEALGHDEKVKAEMSSIFQTPRCQSHKTRSIIIRATSRPITEVLLTLYTPYHSTISVLLLSWFEHNDLVKLIGVFDWMKPLMNYRKFHSRCPHLPAILIFMLNQK